MRCIVIDDEPTARLGLCMLLEGVCRVDQAGNAETGLGMIRSAMEEKDPYALVCLDLCMPGINGIEALKEIRNLDDIAHGKPTKVVMITASEDTGDVIESFRRQADGYLIKPVSALQLGEMLGQLHLSKAEQ